MFGKIHFNTISMNVLIAVLDVRYNMLDPAKCLPNIYCRILMNRSFILLSNYKNNISIGIVVTTFFFFIKLF